MAAKLSLRFIIRLSQKNYSSLMHQSFINQEKLFTKCLAISQNRLSQYAVGQFHTKSKNSEDPNEQKPSLYQRLKAMYKDYWYILVPVHLVTSAVWFGGFYYLAISGLDIVNLLEVIGAPETWIAKMRETKAGGIVTAYTMYKIATPARYAITLGGTTISINYLKKYGYIKPMPNTEQLRSIYEEKKSDLNRAREEIKDEFIKTQKEITQHMKEAKIGFVKSAREAGEEFKTGVKETANEIKAVSRAVTKFLKDDKDKQPEK